MRRGTYLSREAAIGAIEELRKDPRAEGKQDKIEKILLKYGADEDDTDPDEGLYASMYTNDIRNAYEDILDLLTKELVDVYVQVDSGWKLLYEQIPEDIAENIWHAGFATGENKISIETETSKRVREYNKQALRGKINSSTRIKASKIGDKVIYFRDWVKQQYGEDFDLSGLSDEEYYDLEDAYRDDIPRECRERNYR